MELKAIERRERASAALRRTAAARGLSAVADGERPAHKDAIPDGAVGPTPARGQKVWIDLDNSPHVPFFVPIIQELKRHGCSVIVTARDCFQVCDLADLFGLEYRRIGRHYGKAKLAKLAGLAARAAQLAGPILKEKPELAVSHGSRAQLVVSAMAGIPSVVIVDYEFARGLTLMKPSWVMVPEVIPDDAVGFQPDRILKYPGIKEDVYVPNFRPDSSILGQLEVHENDLIVTVRPPATEAHYHNPESEELFAAVIDFLAEDERLKVILLPRNRKQEDRLRAQYPQLFSSGKLRVPTHAVDGLNLIWHSDLVISGGGTMNREAAALGVPVYSVFRGRIGAVDHYLANAGRLTLLERVEDVRNKIALERRSKTAASYHCGPSATLHAVSQQILKVLAHSSAARAQAR